MTLAQFVLNQTVFYNGHGQMEISSMSIFDVYSLLQDLESELPESSFVLELWSDKAASIYQVDYDDRKLWLGVNEIVGL
jgi:hypothetical protein